MSTSTSTSTSENNSEPSRARTISRIQKLLAIAEDVPDTPEGVTARSIAEGLIAKWGVEPAELENLPLGTASPPFTGGRTPSASVPLGGASSERYREQYRAIVLAVLAELAGCKSTYNPDRWVGKLYGSSAATEAVAACYVKLTDLLQVRFHKWWIRKRFGHFRKAYYAKLWWLTVARAVQDLVNDPPEGLSDSTTLVLGRIGAEKAESEFPSLQLFLKEVAYELRRLDEGFLAELVRLRDFRG